MILMMAERQKTPQLRVGINERQALGRRLREARNGAGLTLEKAAERLEVVRQAISKWESGHTFPTVNRLEKAAELYAVSMDWLMGKEKRIGEAPAIYYPGESPPTDGELRLAMEFIRALRRQHWKSSDGGRPP